MYRLTVVRFWCLCRGSVPPDVLLPHPDWQPVGNLIGLEEVGPLMEHVYEVRLTSGNEVY